VVTTGTRLALWSVPQRTGIPLLVVAGSHLARRVAESAGDANEYLYGHPDRHFHLRLSHPDPHHEAYVDRQLNVEGVYTGGGFLGGLTQMVTEDRW